MNNDIIRNLDFKIVTEIKQKITFSISLVHCQEMKLFSFQFCLIFRISAIHLVSVVLKQEHDLDQNETFEDFDSEESQLNLVMNQLNEDQDSMNISTQLL